MLNAQLGIFIRYKFERDSVGVNKPKLIKQEETVLMRVCSRGSMPDVKPLLEVVTAVQEPQPVTHK